MTLSQTRDLSKNQTLYSFPRNYFKMKNEKELKAKSKFLSLVLRHRPEIIGIILNENGWVNTGILLSKLNAFGKPMSLIELEEVVENNNKKRFAFSDDKTMIRANQGHSIEVDLGYTPSQPPEYLYHGTAKKFLDNILAEGIKKRNRHHVHLSAEETTAKSVGSRHGSPVILKIPSALMAQAGIKFYVTKNKVWLTEYVNPKYIHVK